MFDRCQVDVVSPVEDDARARLLAHPETAWLPGELDPILDPAPYPFVPVPGHLASPDTDTDTGSDPGSDPRSVVGVAGRLAAVVAPGAGLDAVAVVAAVTDAVGDLAALAEIAAGPASITDPVSGPERTARAEGIAVGCVADLPEEALLDAVTAGRRLVSWAMVAQMVAVSELARRRAAQGRQHLWDAGDGHEAAATEAALASGMSTHAAHRLLTAGIDLPVRFPRLYAHLSAGLIDWDKALLFVTKTDVLTQDLAHRVEEQALAGDAFGLNRPQLAARLDRLVAQADPAGARERAADAARQRSVAFAKLADGLASMNLIAGAGDVEAARRDLDALTEAARTGLHPITGPGGREASPDRVHTGADDTDGRHPAAVRADVLLDLIAHAADLLDATTGPTPTPGPDPAPDPDPDTAHTTQPGPVADPPGEPHPPDRRAETMTRAAWDRAERLRRQARREQRDRKAIHIYVTIPWSTLAGYGEEPAVITGYGPIPAQMAREVAARGTWRCAIIDDRPGSPTHGTLLGLGRTTYTPTYTPGTPTREFLTLRDGTCVFPGCRRQAIHADLDHRDPWHPPTPDGTPGGGATCECNLQALCRTHHRLKHSGGFRATVTTAGLEWTTRTGRTYTTHTEPQPTAPIPAAEEEPPPF